MDDERWLQEFVPNAVRRGILPVSALPCGWTSGRWAAALTLLLALLLRLRQQWRGWPLGEPACTCRRCCVKPLAERRWQSTHGRQALKKTAVPEPARELPLAKQARALRRPHAAGCPGRCAIAPAGWMANLWRGARGRGGTARHSTWSTSRGGSGKEILNARSSGTLP